MDAVDYNSWNIVSRVPTTPTDAAAITAESIESGPLNRVPMTPAMTISSHITNLYSELRSQKTEMDTLKKELATMKEEMQEMAKKKARTNSSGSGSSENGE